MPKKRVFGVRKSIWPAPCIKVTNLTFPGWSLFRRAARTGFSARRRENPRCFFSLACFFRPQAPDFRKVSTRILKSSPTKNLTFLEKQQNHVLRKSTFLVFGEKHVFHQKTRKTPFSPFFDKIILLQLMTIALLRLYNQKRTNEITPREDHTISLIWKVLDFRGLL